MPAILSSAGGRLGGGKIGPLTQADALAFADALARLVGWHAPGLSQPEAEGQAPAAAAPRDRLALDDDAQGRRCANRPRRRRAVTVTGSVATTATGTSPLRRVHR